MSETQFIRMILVDDKAVTTDLDRAGYRKMGVFVRAAVNYEETSKAMAKEKIDLIVINLDFAGVDGTALTRHLKSQPEFSAVPIVLTSVRTSARVRTAALEAGADLFVEQPLPRQYFIEKLKQLLEQKTRNNDRIEGAGDVKCEFNGTEMTCPISDLSQSGILVAATAAIPEGTDIVVEFDLPGGKKPVRIKGLVVRNLRNGNQITGVGIRFVQFIGDAEKRLEKHIAKTAQGDNKLQYYL